MTSSLLACTRDFAVEPLIGVYLLMKKGRVMYVGQSTDLVFRIYAHKRCWNFDSVRWIQLDESDLLAYEGALARALNPPWTRRVSSNKDRDAEILSALGLEPDLDCKFERRVKRRNAVFGGRTRRNNLTRKEHERRARLWRRWDRALALWSAVQPFIASNLSHTHTVVTDSKSVDVNDRVATQPGITEGA